jgi:predicted aspartyl protease
MMNHIQLRARFVLQSIAFGIAVSWGSFHSPGNLVQAQSSSQIQAIVQLQGMEVPSPKVAGQAKLPYSFLKKSKVYSVNGKLNDLEGRFLVDTGASTTLISETAINQLKLPGREVPQRMLSFAMAGNQCNQISATLHTLPTLKFQTVLIQGASGLNFTAKELPDQLTGILGMDILKYFDLQVDPPTRQLELTPKTTLPAPLAPIAIPLYKRKGVFLANIQLGNQGTFSMLLDTGAGSTFISQQVAQRLSLDKASRRPQPIQGFCGLEQAERSQMPSLQIGPHQQQNVEAIILSSSILKLLGVDGILGQNVLENYRQYWRFTPTTLNGKKADGSLVLSAP